MWKYTVVRYDNIDDIRVGDLITFYTDPQYPHQWESVLMRVDGDRYTLQLRYNPNILNSEYIFISPCQIIAVRRIMSNAVDGTTTPIPIYINPEYPREGEYRYMVRDDRGNVQYILPVIPEYIRLANSWIKHYNPDRM